MRSSPLARTARGRCGAARQSGGAARSLVRCCPRP